MNYKQPDLKSEFKSNGYAKDRDKSKSKPAKSAYERIIKGLSEREKEKMAKHSR